MVAELLAHRLPSQQFAELLRPEPLPDGADPEERLIVCGLSWQRYLDLDQAFGDDRPGPRLYYLDGELEIMTTSKEHERVKKWIGDFVGDYFFQHGIEVVTLGQATIRGTLSEAGAEPDESWCVAEAKEIPDLVLEIAMTSGGLNKLEIYRRLAVREVWFWRRDALEIFALRPSGSGYEATPKSQLLPQLDIPLLERCVRMRSWTEARRTFRASLPTGSP
jgi:Uma2 family endonuclease